MCLCCPPLVTQKAYKRETEVDNWISKYDTEMGLKQVWKQRTQMHNEYSDTHTHMRAYSTQHREKHAHAMLCWYAHPLTG